MKTKRTRKTWTQGEIRHVLNNIDLARPDPRDIKNMATLFSVSYKAITSLLYRHGYNRPKLPKPSKEIDHHDIWPFGDEKQKPEDKSPISLAFNIDLKEQQIKDIISKSILQQFMVSDIKFKNAPRVAMVFHPSTKDISARITGEVESIKGFKIT